ncbi:uncharacterized protein PV09_04120 [Verruconis gallopava]|uniref:Enoyl reductase (ER) domain-containing protein n=1 Tax=Verruconis gallopava TaxID=253628 RepID=A0A0D1YWA2_9PEZI|nr:uncharacterized protein PV09_04120 [Verruconis gallopava]KIW04957.1 hypothetical protein PV09_04120 [Verruconis gallopava]
MPLSRAIVCRGRHDQNGWKIEEVQLRELKDDELLVRIVASGICHTDLMFGDRPDDIGGWPRVMGHEGSGYVQKTGAKVTVARVGDPVLLSFAACRSCKMCVDGHASHCADATRINFCGSKVFSSASSISSQPDILGLFFGQSSFSNLSIVNESSVVNVASLVKSEDELRLFSPLGCGIQTGSGTIVNVANATPSDTVAIMGAGGVGLAAVMGAKIARCSTIIIIDRVQQRLELAKELGATHAIHTGSMKDLDELVKQVRELTGGYGTTITMDATGVVPLICKGIEFTARRGQYIQVGSTGPDAVIKLPIQEFMTSGKRIMGAVEGQVTPQEYVPKMISWYRAGEFPFNKLVTLYRAEDFMDALGSMKSGEVIKPIIAW